MSSFCQVLGLEVWSCVKLLFIAAVLGFGGVLYYYVSTKDTLEFRSKIIDLYIERELSNFFPDADVKIQDSSLSWRRADENFFLFAKGITIVDKTLGIEVEIPEVSIYSKIGILFLWGDWGSSRVDISSVTLSVFDPEKSAVQQQKPFSIASFREGLLSLVRSNIPVKIGSMLFNSSSGSTLQLDFLNFGTEKEYDGRVFSLEFASNTSSVKVQLSEHYKGVVSLRAKYSNFDTGLLEYIRFLDSRISKYRNVLLSGTAEIVLDAHNNVEYGDINLQSLTGTVPYGPDENGAKIHSFNARARYSDHELQVTDFNLLVDDVALRMKAYMNSISGKLDVDVSGYELSTRRVCSYWPEGLYPDLKLWYCENVKCGIFREPQVSFHGHVEDIGNVANYKISSHVKDASVQVSDNLGSVKIVDGGLLLDKGDLIIRSGDYSFMGIDATEGVAKIVGVSNPKTSLVVRGAARGDVVKLYEAAGGKDRLGVESENISGHADTRFMVEVFDLGEDTIYSKLYIKSDIEDMRIHKAFDSFDVYDMNMSFVLHGDDMSIKAVGRMNNNDIILTATGSPWDGGSISYEFDGHLSGDNLQSLSSAARKIRLGGSTRARIHWVSNYSEVGISKVEGELDVSDLFSGEGYFGMENQYRALKFSALVDKDGSTKVEYANIEGQDVDIRLSGSISGGKVDLVADRFKLLKTDANGFVKSENGNLVVRLDGDFLDFSKVNFGTFMGGGGDPASTMYNVDISIQSREALMKNSVLVKDLYFNLNYDDTGRARALVGGHFANDNAALSIEYGPRGLEVTAENAGSFLRAIDVLNTVHGGHLSIYMYPDGHNEKATGTLSVTRFSIVGAPILAQILTISSLKGISNTLSGGGIYFSKLNVPFHYAGSIISFEESWIEGTELGISLGGDINFSTKSFDVSGQIVPAYAVNKVIWRTPLVGKLLTGGYSRGVVAVDYKVKGTDKAHDISVNLLSILAPNILKRVLKMIDYKIMNKAEDPAA